MRISDWSSDVCSSDLRSDWWVIVAISLFGMVGFTAAMLFGMRLTTGVIGSTIMSATPAVTAGAAVVFFGAAMNWRTAGDRKSVVSGKSVSVRVDLGGRRFIKKKRKNQKK